MAPEVQETPFVKQLASSDRKIREDALESIRTYLLYKRDLSELDLLKLWRGLFFCLYHTPHPTTQHTLCTTLSTLLLPLPTHLFPPFLSAFWTTIISEYTSIPQLRLDKYLLLIRCYIHSTFTYLSTHAWDADLVKEWRAVMEGDGKEGKEERLAPLSAGNVKVPDGVRYHVLDVWVDELVKVVEGVEEGVLEMVMAPVGRIAKEGRTKIVRGRAKDVLGDERLKELVSIGEGDDGSGGEEEWGGIED